MGRRMLALDQRIWILLRLLVEAIFAVLRVFHSYQGREAAVASRRLRHGAGLRRSA